MHKVHLPPEEEKLAQLLTRDAWLHFSSLITQRDLFHVKEIPMMPREGVIEFADDLEIIQYYADFAENYLDELVLRGIPEERSQLVIDSFIERLETATGIRRGMGQNTALAS